MTKTNEEILKKATNAVVKTLIDLTNKDICRYFSASSIAINTPIDKSSYGKIEKKDVNNLLSYYVLNGLINKEYIESFYDKHPTYAYSINDFKKSELESIVKNA